MDQLGLEHSTFIGKAAQKGFLQALQILGCKSGVFFPPSFRTAAIYRPAQYFFRTLGSKFGAQYIKHMVIDHSPILERIVKLLAKGIF